jgi:Ricin-type beta-trefoil lectin domain
MTQVEKKIMPVALFALVASSLLYASDSSAGGLGIVNLRNVATGRCLDSNNAGSVYTLACNGGAFQKWNITFDATEYQLRNAQTGRCLYSNAQGNVYANACSGGPYQRWVIFYVANNRRVIINKATGRCLDSNAQGAVYTLTCNAGNFQVWY